MSEVASETAGAPVALDRVMLAMDVVDTLRHQRAQVDAELDDDRRQQEFVARVQAIYRSQGIDVDEAVIRDGVRALAENRFVYTPPERSWSVRLAEVYVERGTWSKRAAIVLLVVAAVWTAFAVPRHYHHRGLVDGFARRTEQLVATAEARARAADELLADWERAHGDGDSVAVARLLADASAAIARGQERVEAVQHELSPLPDAEAYPAARTVWDERLAGFGSTLDAATADLGTARSLLATVAQLRSLQTRADIGMQRLAGLELSARERALVDALQRDVRAAIDGGDDTAGQLALEQLDLRIGEILAARQRQADTRAEFASLRTALDGVDVEAAAKAELQQLHTAVEQAIAADDWQRAGQQVARLRALVTELDQTYELRIVSRADDRSGVWRYEGNDRSRRNYYIVVEAIGPDGRALALPITSEEDQTTRSVRRFAIRVPESVYERVKADKLDNGLIDDVVFGQKRRGAREPEYRFPVAGGRITQW
ncbi:MAG: hypothetical protein JNM25_14430 [Planctomycetes bacterium]|nr:hypothetical protein [Planctomycetota bacterium]